MNGMKPVKKLRDTNSIYFKWHGLKSNGSGLIHSTLITNFRWYRIRTYHAFDIMLGVKEVLPQLAGEP